MGALWVMVIVAFGTAALLCFALADPRTPWFMADEANERSLHDGVKPRGGGLGIIFATVMGLAVAGYASYVAQHFAPVLLGALIVATVSLLDDWRGVNAIWKGSAHAVAAVVVVVYAAAPGHWSLPALEFQVPTVLGAAVAAVALVWMTNLYNFMDGVDGFAGGMGLIGFGMLALLGAAVGAWHFALLCLAVAAACAGFLTANFPPARIFMGDVGASTMGFLAGTMILWAHVHMIFPWWVGAMVFSPFVADATVTLARRALAREKVWQAHRSHFYQRLVGLGWSHTRIVCCGYLLMGVSAGMALWAHVTGPLVQWFLVTLLALTYTSLMLLVTGMERRQGLDLARSDSVDPDPAVAAPGAAELGGTDPFERDPFER